MAPNEIIITNFHDNETINYSVILVKGIIIHHCQNENKELQIYLNEIPLVNYRFKNEQFKILLELKSGENNLQITYCCIFAKLKVNFLKPSTPFKVLPLYIINKNHNGKFQAPENIDNSQESANKRIEIAVRLLQCVVAEKLYEDGFGRKTFAIDDCQVFHSNLDVEEVKRMGQNELWECLGREIMSSTIGDVTNKYLGFLACTRYVGNRNITSHDRMVEMTEGYVAIGGGGLALLGTACMYTLPETILEVFEKFDDKTSVDTDNFLNDSCYRNTLGACFSTTLGSVLHELCHTFDLGHTEHGVMGRGFDNIHKFFMDLPTAPVKFEGNHLSGQFISNHRNEFIRKSNILNSSTTKNKSFDETYFTKSCSALLYYHRFFNNYQKGPDNFVLTVDRMTKFVRSTVGIRVVEIREINTEMVSSSWIFSGKVLKYSFQIPDDIRNKIIVIEDNLGNILKDENNTLS